jgi:hypothetical protein
VGRNADMGMKSRKQRTDEAYVYFLLDPRDGLIRYVGMTQWPGERFRYHCKDRGRGRRRTKKQKWIERLCQAGLTPRMDVRYSCTNVDRALVLEARLIEHLRKDLGPLLTNADPQRIKHFVEHMEKIA